jgi:hypothetical protein
MEITPISSALPFHTQNYRGSSFFSPQKITDGLSIHIALTFIFLCWFMSTHYYKILPLSFTSPFIAAKGCTSATTGPS